jgi:hypothetical protein
VFESYLSQLNIKERQDFFKEFDEKEKGNPEDWFIWLKNVLRNKGFKIGEEESSLNLNNSEVVSE